MIPYLLIFLMYSHGIIYTEHVGWIELNHFYNERGEVMLDQVIVWDLAKHIDVAKDGKESIRRIPKVYFWYILDHKMYREQLSDTEYKKRNRKYQHEWYIKYPKSQFVPNYVRPFVYGPRCPQLENGRVFITINKAGRLFRFIGNFYVETWTQYDPEVYNRIYFSQFERRNPPFLMPKP